MHLLSVYRFGILRPDWLTGTTFSTTNYLLRQPTPSSIPRGVSNYTLADLFKVPNTLGMTNSWLVTDSPIGEPIRLEGPDRVVRRRLSLCMHDGLENTTPRDPQLPLSHPSPQDQPSWRSVLEFSTFSPQTSFPAGVFAIPAACNHTHATTKTKPAFQKVGAAVGLANLASRLGRVEK